MHISSKTSTCGWIHWNNPPHHHWFWIPTTANRNQIKPQKEQHAQLQYPLLQDTVQTYVILPPDHPRMEQPVPGNSGSQVPGLFQVQACCPPVTRQTTPPLPPPLLFLMSTTPPHLLCHTPFHYISEVSTATSTNQHNHHNIDVGWLIEEEEEWQLPFIRID